MDKEIRDVHQEIVLKGIKVTAGGLTDRFDIKTVNTGLHFLVRWNKFWISYTIILSIQ